MQIIDLIAGYGPWSWMVAGLVLLALELVAPGGFFLWLGISGIATGILAFVPGISQPIQWVIFGALGLVSVLLWRRYSKGRSEVTDQPFLNNRAERFVGHEAVIDTPIVNGFGKLKLGDTDWRISGPDLAAGSKVRVVGHDVGVLKVVAA
ncbi:MAG TPA: NfeD family protein [Devosia sp.]|nr:NfeD family protein [Devosia sp.]